MTKFKRWRMKRKLISGIKKQMKIQEISMISGPMLYLFPSLLKSTGQGLEILDFWAEPIEWMDAYLIRKKR